MATGNDSTSLPPEQALQEEMLLDNGVKRLGRMAAVESVARNLEMEDRAVERDIAGHEQMLFGTEPAGSESDEMSTAMPAKRSADTAN